MKILNIKLKARGLILGQSLWKYNSSSNILQLLSLVVSGYVWLCNCCVGLYRAMQGYLWLCRAIYGYVGPCMAMYGFVWLCMAMYGCVGLCIAIQGYVGLCRSLYASVWLCMAMYGYVGLCRAMQSNVGLCRAMQYSATNRHTKYQLTWNHYMVLTPRTYPLYTNDRRPVAVRNRGKSNLFLCIVLRE